MPSVFESYKSGLQARQAETSAKSTEEFKGLQMESVRAAMRSRKATAVRAAGVDQAYSLYGSGDVAGAKEAFRGLGVEGRAALKDIGASEKATREQAIAELQQWGPAAMQMKGDERGQSDLWLAQKMQEAGAIGAGVARSYMQSDPETKDAILKSLSTGDTSRIPGDWVEYDKGDGTTIMMNEADTEDQEMIRANRDTWKLVPKRKEVGVPGEFATDKRAAEFSDAAAATENLVTDIYELQDFIKENPDALTTAAGAARVATNLKANVDVLMSAFDVEVEDESVLDVENYEDFFDSIKGLGTASGEVKSMVLGVGAQLAIINNPGGRISDFDLKNAIRQLSGDIQTAEGFLKVTDRLAKRAVRVFRVRYKKEVGKEYEGSLGLREKKEIPTISGDEEYKALPSGAIFIGPDGKRRTKP